MRNLLVINRILLCLFLCFMGSTASLWAEEGKLSKTTLKCCRKVCVQLKKEGWAVYDGRQSVEEVMMQYYQLLEAGADSVLHAIGQGKDRNVNRAYNQARHHVTAGEALRREASIKVITEILTTHSSEKYFSNSLIHTEQSMKLLEPVVSLYRKKEGEYEVQLLYLIKH